MDRDPLITFKQYGFVESRRQGAEVFGACPFCGADKDHFSINIESDGKQWHCFKCSRGGGFQKFLQTIIAESDNDPKIDELAKNRGLRAETLKAARIGWFNERWVVPIFGQDGETVLNIKIYDGDSFKNTAGCSSAMYGLWAIPEEYNTVYVAEGEWDALSLMEMITDDDAAILGVPGAGAILRPEIVELFVGKEVYLLYDNDPAGRSGCKKSLETLTPVAAEIKVLRWPETAGDGWDVRDVYVKDHKGDAPAAISWIKSHCEIIRIEIGVKDAVVCGSPVGCEEVYEAFDKYFKLSNNAPHEQRAHDIYDVIFGTVFANRIPGDPVWLYIIAPPGGFKTEPLLALSGGKGIEIHESVTAPALISGQANNGGVDPSLIPQLNGRLLIIKDWTIILGLPEHERKEILSILRGAFDGVCGRTFGNGVRRNIKSTFGIIAATTPIVEQYTEETSAVGERFLSWRNWIAEDFATRYAHIKQALENTSHEITIRKEINSVGKRLLLSPMPKDTPACSDANKDIIIKMSQWISVMRGTVSRDKFRRNVLHKPFTELGTRLSKEILKLLMGIAIFKNKSEIGPDEMRIARSVARSSVSARYMDTLRAFFERPEATRTEVEKVVGLPDETIEVVLENMSMLGSLKREKGKWKIREEFLTLTKGAGLC
jgi:hypothetical protein